MKRFLSICILLLFGCGSNQKQHSSEEFALQDKPTIEGIYQTPTSDYIGEWIFEGNCGKNHGGKGNHKIREFKNRKEIIYISDSRLVGKPPSCQVGEQGSA